MKNRDRRQKIKTGTKQPPETIGIVALRLGVNTTVASAVAFHACSFLTDFRFGTVAYEAVSRLVALKPALSFP